ncbi:type II secretion system F family protein [Helcococcus sueciensis]|uniref:type II secretion system F family protein n=1 Tax=Helcococcus sueciensis TaxID=241555 RepID=UPI000411B1E8|nr:hypothetical protein [Helcococcus sueciensis]
MNNKLKAFIISTIIFFVYLQVFFNQILISIIISPIISIKFSTIIINLFNDKDIKQKRIIFREFLDLFNTNILAGNNLLISLRNTHNELKTLFNEDNFIVIYLEELLIDIDNGKSIEDSLRIFERKTELEEVSIFIDSLIIAINSGIDIFKISNISKDALTQNIALELEISTIVNNSKKEFLIMIILPLVIILMLNTSINEKITFADYIVRIPVFIVLLFSFVLGEKIVNMEI